MVTDISRNLIPSNVAVYLKNCVTTYNATVGNGQGQSLNAGSITPIQSNSTEFSGIFTEEDITGKILTVGSIYDTKLNQMVWMAYNDAGDHSIWLYDANLNTVTLVKIETLFDFDFRFRISSIDLVLVDTRDGNGNAIQKRLLYWTNGDVQGGTFPAKINIDTAIAGGYNAVPFLRTPDEYFQAIKYPPTDIDVLNTLPNPDTTYKLNFVANKLFQFRYRFFYDDGEHSTWSAISTLAFSVIEKRNFIQLVMSAGSGLVVYVELAFRLTNVGDWKSYDVIFRDTITANVQYPYDATTNLFTYKFFNNQQYNLLDQNDVNRPYDLVPIKAGAQAFVQENVLIYGDILEGYDNLTKAQQETPTIDVTYATIRGGANGTTLTLAISLFFTAAAPGDITIEVHQIDGITGVDSIIDTHQNGLFPPLVYSVAITSISIKDRIYLHFYGSGTINNLSTITGTYTNSIYPNWQGYVGNFTVEKLINQAAGGGAHITFERVVSDPSLTWNKLTNEDVVPAYAIVFPQLKQGGTYKFGFEVLDAAMRSTFVQTWLGLKVDIESVQQNGMYQNQLITIDWNGLVLPDYAYGVRVLRTKNTTIDRSDGRGYLQFSISDVKFVDYDGTESPTPTGNTKNVKFTINNLIDFNVKNFENTTTTYTWTPNDRVQFIRTGGGGWYDLTNYQFIDLALNTDPVSPDVGFICDYIPDLSNLTSGALVQFYTPSKQEQTDLFFETGDIILTNRVAGNNQLLEASTIISTFDTYPIQWDTTFAPDTVTDSGATPFEHHSIFATKTVPSNGEDIGRINVVNVDARQIWYPARVRWSNAYIPNSFYNGLSAFEEANKEDYFRQYGSITQFHADGSNLAIFQEDKVFRVMINKNLLTLADGGTQITATDKSLSDPIEIEGDFGLQDSSTFQSWGNMMYFIDTKRAAQCICDWSKITDVSSESFMKSYFEAKCKHVFNANLSHQHATWLLHSGWNPKFKLFLTTFFLYQDASDDDYINNLYDVSLSANETVTYSVNGQNCGGFTGFAPELYCYVDGHRHGLSMVTFKQGIPYFHELDTETTFNNFYGTQTDQYIRIIANESPQTEKKFLTIGYDSKSKTSMISGVRYGANDVVTSDFQTSVIPVDSFKFFESFYFSNFYLNTSYGGTIFTGENLRGSYIQVGLLRDTDPAVVSKYNELSKIIVNFMVSAKAIK